MTMRNFTTRFLEIIVMLIFLQHHLVASLSPIQQKTALFLFKQSLNISSPNCFYNSYVNAYRSLSHPKTKNWSMSSDYCAWEGVSCEHKTGHVIGLDLSCSQLEGAILPNSTLFQLSHLRFLNLFGNDFSLSNQFPQEFGVFAKGLMHLNLSNTRLSGRVPTGISHLYKLVSLDLSRNYGVELEDDVFKSLLQNLTQLRVLNLEVFHLPNLELLDLSNNDNLTVTFPNVKWGSSASLQHLFLGGTNIHGGIPDSIGFLHSLATLSLSSCNLSGPIPRSIGNLGQLTYLGLYRNNLNGPISTLSANLTNLIFLSLSYNNFTDLFPSFVAHFKGLSELYLSHNGFSGPLPLGLFNHPSLEVLDLGYNGFTGQLNEFDSSKSHLQSIYCDHNLLYGHIPQSFSQLVNLTDLDFSSNNFNGVLDIERFSGLESLRNLDFSHNSLTVRSTSMATLPPTLSNLGLSSCSMKEFPHFSRDAEISLEWIDLSNNDIEGELPQWIGSAGWFLNLSHNRLTGGLEQLPWNNILYLDLHSNMLNGSLPTLICNSSSLEVLNLSHNNLSGVLPICSTNKSVLTVLDLRNNSIRGNIPANLSNFRDLKTLNLNGNKLQGRIPSSFAEFNSLEVLDLGNNQINDTFPQCLEALPNLQVLVFKSNKLHGHINKSSKIKHPFPSLRIIDISYNEFSGPLPEIYFRNFKAMMNGEVNESKPRYMGNNVYSDSTALVIKGVQTELVRILTVFTTIDASRNNFEGKIPDITGKLVSLRYLNLSHNHLRGHIPSSTGKLSMLESVDLSCNQLEGEIPQQLTSINTLARLNLSFNQLRGHIPQGPQFNTFENDSYFGNLGLCGYPLSKKCEIDIETQEEDDEDDDYFFSGFTWEAVVIGYGCGVVPAFIAGYFMLLAGKPKWFSGIIARELGLKIRRMEIKCDN